MTLSLQYDLISWLPNCAETKEPAKPLEEKVSFSNLKKINSETLHTEAIRIAWKAVRDIVTFRIMGKLGLQPFLIRASNNKDCNYLTTLINLYAEMWLSSRLPAGMRQVYVYSLKNGNCSWKSW